MRLKRILWLFVMVIPIGLSHLYGQKDTTRNGLDSFLLKRKGLIGKFAKQLLVNKNFLYSDPSRIDLSFINYDGKTIRNIFLYQIPFGTPINDTTLKFRNKLTKWGESLHKHTRP